MLKRWEIKAKIPHAEEVGRAPIAKRTKEHLTFKWRGTEGPKVKASEQNTSRLSDEEGPYAKARKQNTSRLRDEKNSHV